MYIYVYQSLALSLSLFLLSLSLSLYAYMYVHIYIYYHTHTLSHTCVLSLSFSLTRINTSRNEKFIEARAPTAMCSVLYAHLDLLRVEQNYITRVIPPAQVHLC